MINESRTVEFDGVVDGDGNIRVPLSALKQLEGTSGKLRIRLSDRQIASTLRRNSVDEEEIDRIAAIQLESRDQVVKFLLSEGALKKERALVRRLQSLKGRRG